MLKNIILKVIPTKSKGISNQRTLFSKKCSTEQRLKVSQPMRLEMGLTSFLSMARLKVGDTPNDKYIKNKWKRKIEVGIIPILENREEKDVINSILVF